MKVSELLKLIGPRPSPIIGPAEHFNEAVRAIIRESHSRRAYVVDAQGKLVGCLSISRLLRHLFPHHYEERIHALGLLRRLTAETAESLMSKRLIHATPKESVEEVLRRMARSGVKEMAVLDAQGRVVGDVTAVDLLRHYHLEGEAEGGEND